MEYYTELMERVRYVVEEKLCAVMDYSESIDGVTVSVYCETYGFSCVTTIHYRDIELADKPVLEIANRIVDNFECELVGNIERN